MAIVEHTYFQRAKCNGCDDILWTTDMVSGVVCPCRETEITPMGIMSTMDVGYSMPMDTEHREAVKQSYGIPSGDTIYLIQG